MTTVAGQWELTIATPIGKLAVVLEIHERDGIISGTARGAAESTPLIDPVLVGDRLTWSQAISKPIRLNLTFDVTIDDDTLSGTSKAGRLPSSRVSGKRAR